MQRGTAFVEDALIQGFAMLSRGTSSKAPDWRSWLSITSSTVPAASNARFWPRLVGHIWVCPNCGHLEEIHEEDNLSLMDVTLTRLDVPVGAGGR